jgi:outer membrane protein TolC
MKRLLLLLFITQFTYSQESESVLTFEEYLGYVQKFHPLVKQANLVISESQANLLKARGAFDPKMEIDFNRKTFKSDEYYDVISATFKVPTWYGIELKANFEESGGIYLNPQNTLPEDGLYSAGISFSVGQGLLINNRMAALKQAKYFVKQQQSERIILVNEILYQASMAYFDWLKSYKEYMINEEFLANAELRFKGVKQSIDSGDRAPIDSIEAGITVYNRKLQIEQYRLALKQKMLVASNFLWLENNTPIEIQEDIIPDTSTKESVDFVLRITQDIPYDSNLTNHPKLLSLDYKLKQLQVETRLKRNKLLPTINLEYNFLSQDPEIINSFNTLNYKSGLYFNMPLFLRKERGDFKLAKLKLNNTEYERSNAKFTLSNKLKALESELYSLIEQEQYITKIVEDYQTLVNAEERKLELGDSSIFLINTRENSLIDAKLKAVSLQYKFLEVKAKLFNNLAINPNS